jgi:hypothetical protein
MGHDVIVVALTPHIPQALQVEPSKYLPSLQAHL